MHKYLKDLDQSQRWETNMAALRREDERLDPSTIFGRFAYILYVSSPTC